ncbi:MAG: hypothetical protein ACI4TK_13415 [Agathobacter sp.]
MGKEFISVDEQSIASTKSYDVSKSFDIDGTLRVPEQFKVWNKLILRDLNSNTSSPSFYLYSKDKISEFLKNPYKNQKNLRDAVVYIYGASSHFRRLIQYFAGLTDFAYVVSPYKIDTSSAKAKTIGKQYRRTLNMLSNMDIKNQFPKILTVCLREDTFYGTMWVTNDSVSIQQLPSEYCDISTVEGNVLNVSFNFSYFDKYPKMLAFYPEEFTIRYNDYLENRTGLKWQELSSPTSFAIKCNNDILEYSIPPFAGLLREIYDIEDYKQLKLTKTELENYAMLVMKLGINSDGEWEMDFDKAKEFWRNLDGVLPEEIGSVLSPMTIDKISFEKNNTKDVDAITEAENHLFNAAGVSSLLFNNAKASSGALSLSIKADQAITYNIVKSIECAVNRFIQSQTYGKNFKVTFLNCSVYNSKELGEQYLKACQYGIPMVSYFCASQGLSQSDMDCLNFLEDEVLNIKSRFIPLQSSATQSGSNADSDNKPGREELDIDELTESGEISRENDNE